MAGYGNRTAPDYVADDLAEEHSNTRLGLTDSHHAYTNPHHKYGSGATGGAGFGNKSSSSPSVQTSEEFRFGSHADTSPYSGASEAGSGSTAGAGYGNKTGEFGAPSGDSTLGKIMQKAGTMMHNENMVEKGTAKREEKKELVKEKDEPPFAN